MDPSPITHVYLATVEKWAGSVCAMRRLGVSHYHAAVCAGARSGYWSMACYVTVQQAMPNAYFDWPFSVGGLVHHLTRSKRCGTDPCTPRCGKGRAVSLSSIPINVRLIAGVDRPSRRAYTRSAVPNYLCTCNELLSGVKSLEQKAMEWSICWKHRLSC